LLPNSICVETVYKAMNPYTLLPRRLTWDTHIHNVRAIPLGFK